jgi:hypothetical protein
VDIPRIVFTKGGGLWLDAMRALDCDVLGLDWTVNLGRARAGGRQQGAAGQPRPQRAVRAAEQVEEQVRRVLDSFGAPHTGSRHRCPRTSSTWATASASTRRRTTCRRWSKRSTLTPARHAPLR